MTWFGQVCNSVKEYALAYTHFASDPQMTSYVKSIILFAPPPPLFPSNLDNYMKLIRKKQTIIFASNPCTLLKARSTRSLNPASVSVLASKVRNCSARHKEGRKSNHNNIQSEPPQNPSLSSNIFFKCSTFADKNIFS